MRTLATVQIIDSIEDIPGKDRIKLAGFKSIGYKTIVDLTYKVGDYVVYFEMDSILPDKPEYDFLRSRCWSPKCNGHRIRCMKMGGVFSSGLAMHVGSVGIPQKDCIEGIDVTDFLGVTKYDPEAIAERQLIARKQYNWFISLLLRISFVRKLFGFSKKKAHPFPPGVSKTDETRYQNLPYIYDMFANREMYYTIKMDGQSLTAAQIGKKQYLCSRNINLGLVGNTNYHKVWKKYRLSDILKREKAATGRDICIQGESLGPGIQGNKYELDDNYFCVFNVRNLNTGKYYGFDELCYFCAHYGLDMVRIIDLGSMLDKDALQKMADAQTYERNGVTLPHEGIVVRPTIPMEAGIGMANMASFKVISTVFADKYLSKGEVE